MSTSDMEQSELKSGGESTSNQTGSLNSYSTIEMLASFISLLNCGLIFLNTKYYGAERIYWFSGCYVLLLICVVWCAAAFVKKLKRREVKTRHILILIFSLALSVVWIGCAVKCVKDIAGGTVTITTEFYRPRKDTILVYGEFPEYEDDRILYCTEKISAPVLENFSFDESETLKVSEHISVYKCSRAIEIKYYPNSKLIEEIKIL